jgi:TRAP-type C4-dicarboxylate transport system permease small subunit
MNHAKASLESLLKRALSVDILQQTFSPRLKRVSECVTAAIGVVIFSLITLFGLERALDALQSGDVIAGSIPWPTWPAIALVAFGAGLLALRLAVHFVGHLASLVTGRDMIALSVGGHGDAGEIFE